MERSILNGRGAFVTSCAIPWSDLMAGAQIGLGIAPPAHFYEEIGNKTG